MATTSFHRLLQGFHVPLSVLAPPPTQPPHAQQRGSLASTFPTMDPGLLLRLDFLWQQALAHLPTDPTYSRTLSRQLIRIRDVALVHAALHPRLPDLLCPDCGVILVPGLTARARLHPRRKSCPVNTTQRHHNKPHQASGSGGGSSGILPPLLKNEVTYACLLCQGINKADGVPRRTGNASAAKEANTESKAQTSFIIPPPPPPQQQRERQSPPAAPAEEEEFIPLQQPQAGKKRPYQHQGEPQPPRLLLDAKPRKRKAQEEKTKQQQQQAPKPESRSLGQLRGFLSSLKKP